MNELTAQRKIIKELFPLQTASNAQLNYYTFYHPDPQTKIIVDDPINPTGYIVFSRTRIDLFRPLINWFLPTHIETAAQLIQQTIPSQTAVLLYIPDHTYPLVTPFFDIQSENRYHLYQAANIPTPAPNMLIQQETGKQNYPRFVIKQPILNHFSTVASAGLNWQTDRFADVAIYTDLQYRRRGWAKQLLLNLSSHLLQSGRTPLYQVAENNHPSLKLINQLPFHDTDHRFWLIEATRK